MIEIIREEDFERTERKELPKDIKQIGKPDIGERIYVENQVYEFLHPYDSINEKSAYILLGRFENYAGRQCTFVEAAIRLEEMTFEGELPLWNDQTWAYVYRQLKQEHDSMAIVGWAMDMKGRLPNLTVRLEALHQNNFGGAHQILFLMDSLEQEETFYGSRNGHLYRREGFYIYYDKTIPVRMNRAMESIKREEDIRQEESVSREEESVVASVPPQENAWEEDGIFHRAAACSGTYRRQILEREEKQQAPSYASSFLLLLVVVCAFGITAYANYQKMNSMQETLARMNSGQTVESQTLVTEQESEQERVNVESVAGNVSKEESASSETASDASATQVPTVTDPSAVTEVPQDTQAQAETPQDTQTTPPQDAQTQAESTPVLTEAQTYLAQGYYDVQKGDSLVGICKKIYQTTALMDKLCEINEIEDENAIYAGQRLILPN